MDKFLKNRLIIKKHKLHTMCMNLSFKKKEKNFNSLKCVTKKFYKKLKTFIFF